jgi:hypothetical protein
MKIGDTILIPNITTLPRIGAFHNNPPRQDQLGTSMEVSTSWDTRVYPKCSNFAPESLFTL